MKNKKDTKYIHLKDERLLLDYIEGKLSHEQEHEIEEIMEQNPFLYDAVDGLSEIKDKSQLRNINEILNQQLREGIRAQRRIHKQPRKINNHWGWLYAIIIILFLAVATWYFISVM